MHVPINLLGVRFQNVKENRISRMNDTVPLHMRRYIKSFIWVRYLHAEVKLGGTRLLAQPDM
jgi:hypothetical protein